MEGIYNLYKERDNLRIIYACILCRYLYVDDRMWTFGKPAICERCKSHAR